MTIVRALGVHDYLAVWQAMKQFTIVRDATTQDEIWYLEHFPVYTQGQAGKAEHIFHPGNIPVVQSDRGGQVTYHGPGQLIVYPLLDIQRRKLGIRTLVSQLENAIISLLNDYAIDATTRCGAPGVYIDDQKIASIGLRVRNGKTYHGLALNVNMDLHPFSGINPCGFKALKMANLCDYKKNATVLQVAPQLIQKLQTGLGLEI